MYLLWSQGQTMTKVKKLKIPLEMTIITNQYSIMPCAYKLTLFLGTTDFIFEKYHHTQIPF